MGKNITEAVRRIGADFIAARVRGVSIVAMDAEEVKRSIADCTAKGGPENCPYHKQFVHKEGEGVSSHYNKKKIVEKNGKRVYIDTGASENKKYLSEKEKKEGVENNPEFGTKVYKGGEKKRKPPKGARSIGIVLPEVKEPQATPNIDSFKGVAEVKVAKINELAADQVYVRSADPIAGVETRQDERLKKEVRVAKKGEEGAPMYKWTKGGKEVEPAEALRLEAALGEMKMGAALSADSAEVRIRADLANGFGQVAQYKDGKGNVQYGYSQTFKDACAIEKWKRIEGLFEHYDDIIHKIMADCQKGRKEAIIAYFMYRTKCRVGSKSNPQPNEGRGATSLTTGNFELYGDDAFHVAFPAKNGFWHVTCKDKFLSDFLRKRKAEILESGEGRNSVKVFGVTYGKVNDYLKEISREYVGSDDKLAFRPHNFRHFAATRIAVQKMEEFAGGVDPEKEPLKYETAVCKAITEAARVLNDTPKVVYESYVIPRMLYAKNPKMMVEQFPYLAEKRGLGGLTLEDFEEEDGD